MKRIVCITPLMVVSHHHTLQFIQYEKDTNSITLSCAWGFAPAASSSCTMTAWPDSAASWRAVLPLLVTACRPPPQIRSNNQMVPELGT